MPRNLHCHILASPRWPGWRIAIFYALLCLFFARHLVPFTVAGTMADSEGTVTTLHERIVSWREPTIYQYRWLVPLMAEGISRVTSLSPRHSYMILAVVTMWLVLVSFHMLLRRCFSPAASLAGALIVLMAYVVTIPHMYFHPYDILCALWVVVAIEGIFRKSALVYVAALALLCLTKWVAAAVAVIFLAPAWFDHSTSRSLRWRAVLGGIAVVAIVFGALHIPLIGVDLLFKTPTTPLYAGGITTAQWVASVLDPKQFANAVVYLLPALVGVFWGYRLVASTWRRLLWYPLGILLCGLGAKIIIWETRTYFSAWVVFVPFLLAALFRASAADAHFARPPRSLEPGQTRKEAGGSPPPPEVDNTEAVD